MRCASFGKNLSKELDHVGEGEVGAFGVETRTFIAHEGVLGGVKLNAMCDAGGAEPAFDDFAAFGGNVRVVRTENHEEFATNFGSLRERASVGVFAEFSIVNAGAIEADGSADIRLKSGAKGEVPTDAEAHGADIWGCDLWLSAQPVERSATTGVEIGDWSLGSVFETARAASVVEGDGAAGWLDAVIDFWRNSNEAVTGETNASAEHRAGELENIGIAENAREFAGGVRGGDKHSHD